MNALSEKRGMREKAKRATTYRAYGAYRALDNERRRQSVVLRCH